MRDTQLTDRRPYIIRALYEWMIDNDLTPHLVINIDVPSVIVPIEYSSNGQIILNIAPNAVDGIDFKKERISFSTRFQGVLQHILLPPVSIIAIFARENSEGMVFENHIDTGNAHFPPPLHEYKNATKNKIILSIIKKDDTGQPQKEQVPHQADNKKKLEINNNFPGLRLV
ncbi:Stringent starvation protein B [Candidatus Erwinia haradaeae]|uniref:Stringent starvation protein B n=1 Tax=Candidatus Erwinia haradaeae TaxID=1922217 RepID=A0A451DCA9_9GAMM|nr:ClpXP protease specificity-enhancing factor [Candidatus Erwinia haradaeae]VFP84038.1 Stringent starvation protein B [Candidatus Erwinia haradaeae]